MSVSTKRKEKKIAESVSKAKAYVVEEKKKNKSKGKGKMEEALKVNGFTSPFWQEECSYSRNSMRSIGTLRSLLML